MRYRISQGCIVQGCYDVILLAWWLIRLPFRILWFIIKYICNLFELHQEIVYEKQCEEYYRRQAEKEEEDLVVEPECPDFLQFFTTDEDGEMGVGVERIEMSPYETAVIRIVGDYSISEPYRLRIFNDQSGKYFILNSKRYYL